MLDLPGYPLLDKRALLGGCVRLALSIDAARLRREIAALGDEIWGGRGGRVGVHSAAEAVFLRGYAPAEGEKPIEDRAVLGRLPYARSIIESLAPAQPLRCLLAKLPAGMAIPLHVDRAPYFAKSLRLHFPVETHDQSWMLCAGSGYLMAADEVWVLNNSTEHAVWNAHPTQSRTHLICDFLPGAELLALIAEGRRDLGMPAPEAFAAVRAQARPAVMANG